MLIEPLATASESRGELHLSYDDIVAEGRWAVGCGSSILANPVMFASIQEKIFYVYGVLNFAWIPLVYLFWPEVSSRRV